MIKNNWSLRSLLGWLSIGFLLYGIFAISRNTSSQDYSTIRFSDFVEDVNLKRIKDVIVYPSESTVMATYNNSEKALTQFPFQDQFFISRLLENKVGIRIVYPDEKTYSFWMAMLTAWLPNILLFALLLYSHIGGKGGGGVFGFGKSKARLAADKGKKVTFDDVAGLPEAKDELLEIVDFLKNPDKFVKVGAIIPKGVLLYGPPGTGKTLLARAIAGEAKVPFLYMSGSEFVEMFVGVGASRVRDLFTQAKKLGKCIIFIDEIDSIGKKRNLTAMNDERETTLNQFLVELDGFDTNSGIIVVGATNRIDVLDQALLRPGRFDRLVSIPLPDAKGREEILRVHLSKIKIDPETGVDLRSVVRASVGMSGAQLANIVNEAAIIAGKASRQFVRTDDLVQAMETIIVGSKSSLVLQEKDKETTAYHEAGHATIGLLMETADPIFKATILPTGKALGMVVSLPENDEVSVSKIKLLDKICILMGGRVGEELWLGPDYITSGASSDISMATSIATNMVTKWGMSATVGRVHYSLESELVGPRPSEDMLAKIYKEVQDIIDTQYERARSLLVTNKWIWEGIAKLLLEFETLTGDQLRYFKSNGNLEGYSHIIDDLSEKYIYRPKKEDKKSKNSKNDEDEEF